MCHHVEFTFIVSMRLYYEVFNLPFREEPILALKLVILSKLQVLSSPGLLWGEVLDRTLVS